MLCASSRRVAAASLAPDDSLRDVSGWVSQSRTKNTRRCWESVSLLRKKPSPGVPARPGDATPGEGRPAGRLCWPRRCGRGSSLVIVLSSSPTPRPLLVSSCPALPPAASSRSPTVPPRAQLPNLLPIHAACLQHPFGCPLLPAAQPPPGRLPPPYVLKGFSWPGGYDASSSPSLHLPASHTAPQREAPPTVSRCNFVFFSFPPLPLAPPPPSGFTLCSGFVSVAPHRTRLISWPRCIWRPPAAAADETSFFMKLYNRFCYFIARSPHPCQPSPPPSLPPSHPSRGPAVASRDSQGPQPCEAATGRTRLGQHTNTSTISPAGGSPAPHAAPPLEPVKE